MDEKTLISHPVIRLFNTPVEIAVRCLTILAVNRSESFDIDRIQYLDYLCLHTADIGGPESLHAPVPSRGVQVFSRKETLRMGLNILLSKELTVFQSSEKGFHYIITEAGVKFLEYFETSYFKSLVARVEWVSSRFRGVTTPEIFSYVNDHIQHWGGEFLPNDIVII